MEKQTEEAQQSEAPAQADGQGATFGPAQFGIGRAIKEMRSGLAVVRVGWNGKGQELRLQVPDEHSKMTLPYIYIKTVQGDLVPWLASQTDILAVDWMIVA